MSMKNSRKYGLKLLATAAVAAVIAVIVMFTGEKAAATSAQSPVMWQTDVALGAPYQMRYVNQPDDYSGAVRSTIVRLTSDCAHGVGVLYVHGYNDYFFQDEMARQFTEHCYDFYAVDLRKYGRSIMPGQRKFEARDLREYFADIDSAVVQMQHDGISSIVLMGHSTGGLISAYYMASQPPQCIKALVLNSPFLDWNQSKFQEKFLIPVVDTFAALLPKVNISQGDDDTYARSLLKSMEGEWDYNTDWKLVHSPDVQTSWIKAIDYAQAVVQDFPGIKVPILLMHSDSTYRPGHGDPSRADAVLDVDDISHYGRRLGIDVDEFTVKGCLHDLMLSAPGVRTALYDSLFDWLSKQRLSR